MKRKFLLLFSVATISITCFANIAPDKCGSKVCKGGDDKCCTTKAGDTFYTDVTKN